MAAKFEKVTWISVIRNRLDFNFNTLYNTALKACVQSRTENTQSSLSLTRPILYGYPFRAAALKALKTEFSAVMRSLSGKIKRSTLQFLVDSSTHFYV